MGKRRRQMSWSILNAEAPHRSAPSKQKRNGVGSMRHQEKIKVQRRRRRKLLRLFAAAAVCALLFEEQAAVLYVLSTLAACGVLMVLAFSNLGARDAKRNAAHALTNSTSKDIATSSPTNIPPASSTLFQFRPKSLRLTRVVAERPIRVLPHGSFVGGLGPSTAKTTLRVTPCIVRSPSTDSSPSPFFEI